mgnify:FL=1
MEEKMKSLFEYLKEIYELKTRVVLDYKKFDSEIDIEDFKNIYENITDIHDFSKDISGDEEYFTIKYISVEKAMPKIPSEVKDYVEVNENGISLNNDEDINTEIREKYNQYINEYKKAKKVNELIRKYNSIYEMFFELNRRKNEFEEKIEVILGKGLFVYKTKEGYLIRRHIFEAPIKIDIKQENNTIYLRIDKESKANIEHNFLAGFDFKIKDRDSLLKLENECEEQYLMKDKINFDELYKRYLNCASFKYEYVKDTFYSDVEPEKAYIFNKDNIIVRKKQPTLWMEDLNDIVNKIDNNEFKPENILPYLIVEKEDEKIKELLYSEDNEESLVLFPLASNEEQYKVVRQTNDSNLVLVQGPPGTGKSHTIANLISNYVSYGKKILVTSEKSKALEVIKDKLPIEIRDLSMTLLTDTQNNNELSNSIQIVLDKYKDKDYLYEYQNKIENLEKRLSEITELKKNNYDQIMQILLNNSHDYKDEVLSLVDIKLDSYRLVDIAKYLNNNTKYNYIEDTNNYNNISFDKEMLLEINAIINDLRKYKDFIVGREFDLPEQIDWESYELAIENIKKIENSQIVDELIKEGIDDRNLKDYDINMLSNTISNVIKLENLYDRKYIIENCTYKPRMTNLQAIIDDCNKSKEFFENTETELIGNNIELKSNEKINLSKALNTVYEALTNDGKISILEKIKYKKEISELSNIIVNNKRLDENITEENLKLALAKIKYELKVGKIKNDIAGTLRESSLWELVNEKEFSRTLEVLIDMLSTFINYSQIVTDLKDALSDIFRTNVKVLQYIKNEEYEKIYEEITKAIDYSEYLNSQTSYDDKLHNLETLSVKTYDVFEKIIEAIKDKDIESFKNEREKIEKIYIVDEKYNKLKRKYENETQNYPAFINKYISIEDEERRNIIKNFDEILKYYRLNMYFFYQELNNQKFSELLDKKEKIQKQEKDIVVKLIEQKSWYNQINNMTNTICKALSQWLSLKTKLGKGTGKRANIIRREMQEQMQVAKEAIPIWIMPLDKVIEQYPYSNKPQFDVVIMDESSQSSIISLTALLRGKKMIIVGDDKQISPISVGITIDSLKALQSKYLTNIGLGVGFDMDMSIYDLAQNVCGSKKVVLKEHFRCLPEIIGFSNKYFYGDQINCLKVRSKENTIKNPIETYYLEDATVNAVSSNYLINKKEIDKIIEILKSIENNKLYNKKDIGIIVLQNSNAQIKTLNTAIWQNFSSDFIKERKIKIGNSYEFQGDERDVIILSMVISKKQDDGETRIVKALTTKEFERSFNVAASRAKEQVILVYSIHPNELSKECLRYKLITYYNTFDKNEKIDRDIKLNTDFEKELYIELRKNKIDAMSHFKIGKYELDFVIDDENGKKIAIQCDGDECKSKEEYEADISEQDVLIRCGWKFIRVRASQFYANKEKTVSELIIKINNILSEEDSFNIVEPVFKLKDFEESIEKSEGKQEIEDNKDEDKNNIEDKISEITKNINLTNIYVNDSNKE